MQYIVAVSTGKKETWNKYGGFMMKSKKPSTYSSELYLMKEGEIKKMKLR